MRACRSSRNTRLRRSSGAIPCIIFPHETMLPTVVLCYNQAVISSEI